MTPRAQAHVFIATSLDGFIARPGGEIDWLDHPAPEGEDYGYAAFMAGMDGLIMGRGTFATVLGFPDWPYEKPVTVLSRSLGPADLPAHLAGRVRILPDAPLAALERAAAEGMSRVYVDGGALIRAFLAERLIDEITLTRLPVLIGEGRPLFGPLAADLRLEHLGTRSFPTGLVQSRYRPLQ